MQNTHAQVWQHLVHLVKRLLVLVGLHLLHNDICANCNEVAAVNINEVVVEHLALHSGGCIVCPLEQFGSIHSSCLPVQVSEQQDDNITFDIALLIWLLIVINNNGPMESSEARYRSRRY